MSRKENNSSLEIDKKNVEENEEHNTSPAKDNEPHNQQSQSFKEEQAVAFSQMMQQNNNQHQMPMDKEKLFETFLLFQNFINMNQSLNSNINSINDKTIDSQRKKQDSETKESKESKEILITNTNDSATKKEVENKGNNYDEIPIKPANTNFMELVEQSLANDKGEYQSSEKVRKKIVRPVHQRKVINISKPSKNDKKYSYYTDLLDEKGQFNEDKVKCQFQGSKSTFSTIGKTLKSDSSSKNKIISQQNVSSPSIKNHNKSTDNIFKNEFKSHIPTQTYHLPNEEDSEDNKNNSFEEGTNRKKNRTPEKEKEEDLYPSERNDKMKETSPENEETNENQSASCKAENDKIEITKTEPKELSTPQPVQFSSNNTNVSPNPSANSNEVSTSILNSKKQINKTVCQLNEELAKAKEETQRASRIKSEYEKLKQKLQDDFDRFNIQKSEFEHYKENELKKIQKEKRTISFEIKQLNNLKQQNQSLVLMSKRDKEQIEKLKDQITRIQNEAKQKELNNKLTIEKLKRQIEEANHDNNVSNENSEKRGYGTRISVEAAQRGHSTNPFQKITKSKTSNKFSQKQLGQSKTLFDTAVKYTKSNTTGASTKKQKLGYDSNTTSSKMRKKPNKNLLSSPKGNSAVSSFIGKTSAKIQNNNNLVFERDEENFDFVLPKQYHEVTYKLLKTTNNEGRIINLFSDNKREVIFPSGVKKEVYDDGYQLVRFTNGDLKQMFPDGKNVYYFNDAKTVQTTFPDGLQVFKFNTGQIEKHYPDGTKQISFPDGSLRYILNDGYEETHYADGTIQKIDKENVTTIEHQDGTKEIKYPDGREEFIDINGVKEIREENAFEDRYSEEEF